MNSSVEESGAEVAAENDNPGMKTGDQGLGDRSVVIVSPAPCKDVDSECTGPDGTTDNSDRESAREIGLEGQNVLHVVSYNEHTTKSDEGDCVQGPNVNNEEREVVQGHHVDAEVVQGHHVDAEVVQGHSVDAEVVEGPNVDAEVVQGHSVDAEVVQLQGPNVGAEVVQGHIVDAEVAGQDLHECPESTETNESSSKCDGAQESDQIDAKINSLPYSAEVVAMLQSGSIVLQEQEDVVHLHLEDLENKNGEDSHVILVYQDILQCGACAKQFLDMIEFLEHKSEHMVGTRFYKCELCKMFFTKQTTLVSHYRKRHRLPNFGDGVLVPLDNQTTLSAEVIQNGQVVNGKAASEDLQTNGTCAGDVCKISNVDKDIIELKNPDNNYIQARESDEQEEYDISDGEDSVTAGQKNGAVKTSDASLVEVGEMNRTIDESQTLYPPASDSDTNQNIIYNNKEESLQSNGVKVRQSRRTRIQNAAEAEPSLSESPKNLDFSFILVTEMVKGLSFNYAKNWLKCLHCEYRTQTKTAIVKHMGEKHQDMLDIHQTIDINENLQNAHRKVMKMSAYETQYHRAALSRRRTKRGRKIEKQDIPGVYPCNECGKIFNRLRYLRKHSMTHRSEKKHLCDECGKAFKSRTNLAQHRKIHIKDKLFQCNQCTFQSSVNAAIHAHRQIHNQGSVLCDICGYAYTDKSTLNKHKRVHDLTRPYACNFPGCTWRFKTDIMCKAHIRAHTTEGKFRCSYCGYAFRHKHHLIRHESNMHGIKRARPKGQTISTKREVMDSEKVEALNLVVDAADDDEALHVATNGLTQQHLVVTTDSSGTPITYEAADISALGVAYGYHALIPTQEGQSQDTHTVLMTQTDSQIIFKHE